MQCILVKSDVFFNPDYVAARSQLDFLKVLSNNSWFVVRLAHSQNIQGFNEI